MLVTFTPATTAATIEGLFEELDVEIDAAWFDPAPEDPDRSLSWFHIRINQTSEYFGEVDELVAYLNNLSSVEGAGYNDIGNACGFRTGNPDEFFGHYNSESRSRDTFEWEAQNEILWLKAMEAWEDQSASTDDTGAGIGVVVIDSGVDVINIGSHEPHPDLIDKIYRTSLGNMLGISKQDGKYLVTTMEGGYSGYFLPPTSEDDFAHGTCISGIIGAETFNDDDGGQESDDARGAGIGSCAPEAKIFVALAKWKTKGYTGGPTAASVVDIIKAMKTKLPTSGSSSAHPGLRIVNIAHAWEKPPEGLRKAILKDIEENKRIYIAAAGNTGSEKKMYPAFWDGGEDEVPGLIGVTAATNSGGVNWGYEGADSRHAESTFWNGGKNSSSTAPSNYSVSGYYHFTTTDYNGPDGYAGPVLPDGDRQIIGTDFESQKYVDFYGTSAAGAQVSALAALIYARALKIGRLDGGVDDVTPSGVADMIVDNLKSDPLSREGSDKTVPGVVHFQNAKDEL